MAKRSAAASYEEVVRVLERMLDLQVREFDHQHRTAGEMIRLGVASLAGMLAIFGLFAGTGRQPAALFWVAVCSVGLVVCGLMVLVVKYGGAWRSRWMEVGPDPHLLARAAETVEDERSLLASLADQLVGSFGTNRHLLMGLIRLRKVGLMLLLLGVLVFLAGLALIAGGSIHV